MMQVMVIDMLEGFTRIGPLSSPRIDDLVPRQVAFLSRLPKDSLVVMVADEHSPDDFELKRFPPHCLKGTPEAEIRRELLDAVQAAQCRLEIVRKHQFSGFVGTNLDTIIEQAPQRDWIVCGCVTDCCVEANVAELVYRSCHVTLVKNLIDTWDLSAQAARAASLPMACVHDAEAINAHWFENRFPAIWGVRVLEDWHSLLEEAQANCE